MTFDEYKTLRCGNMVQDDRGICYVVTLSRENHGHTGFILQTLDNNNYHAEHIDEGNYASYIKVSYGMN